MKNGLCPKCGSTDVRSGKFLAKKANWTAGNRIPISMGLYSYHAWLDNYVCVRCGYVESYIADPKTLAEIAERWPAVVGAPPEPPESVWPPPPIAPLD